MNWDELLRQLQGLSLATPPANVSPPMPQGADIPMPNVSVQDKGRSNIGVTLPTPSGVSVGGSYTPGTSEWMGKIGYQKQFAGPPDKDPIGDLLTRNPSWSGGAYSDFRPSGNVVDESKDPWYQQFAKMPTGLNLDYNMQKMVPGYNPAPVIPPSSPMSKALGSDYFDNLMSNVRLRSRRGLP